VYVCVCVCACDCAPQNGHVKLPDVSVTDKNDTFHLNEASFGSFRLMGRAVKRDLYGKLQAVDSIPLATTGKFIVSGGWCEM